MPTNYYKLPNHTWIKHVYATQCPERAIDGTQCQGPKGHNEYHWSYLTNGSLRMFDTTHPDQDRNDATIAPLSTDYVHPANISDKSKDFQQCQEFTVVIDQKLIFQLEQNEPPPNTSVFDFCPIP